MCGKHIHLDATHGVAGNMVLGAFLDAGVPLSVVEDALCTIAIDPNRIKQSSVLRGGISSTQISVDSSSDAEHVTYASIQHTINDSTLTVGIKKRILAMFDYIAQAEAKIHQTSVDEVHFHEVGAIDSLIDIVGVAAILEWCKPTSITASVVAMGYGTIECAHGSLPVPTPASLAIAQSGKLKITEGIVATELCTPTGAAIVAANVTSQQSTPSMIPCALGYGAGRDMGSYANLFRVIFSEMDADIETMIQVDVNIDDMNPEFCDYIAEILYAHGAIDLWWTPIVMKKSRPAVLLSVLMNISDKTVIMDQIFSETTSIGVRYHPVSRRVLDREIRDIETTLGKASVKISSQNGQIVTVSPEYEVCKTIAQKQNIPLKEVFNQVMTAWNTKDSK